jgi:hypothetical protein
MRHIPPSDRGLSERNILSGYGVSLDLKKMDYLALDDRYSHGGNVEGICILLPKTCLKNTCINRIK